MAHDEALAGRVRAALSARADIVEKKLMGGICFMLAGNMCCGVSRSALLVRVGRDAYEATLARPHVRPLEMGGRRARGFVLVDRDGCRTAETLATWIEAGLTFASTLPPK